MTQVSLQSVWRVFNKQFDLDQARSEQFLRYIQELLVWNTKINLTAARNERELVQLHCADALMLTKFIDMRLVNALADVGCGAGLPGIPLSIMFPEKTVYLLEVSNKKIKFLEHVIATLQLKNVQLISLDWRTFLRKTNEPIDLFCARASLDPDELMRMFKPASPYKQASLIYWASELWQPSKKVGAYIRKEHVYHCAYRKRRLVLLHSDFPGQSL